MWRRPTPWAPAMVRNQEWGLLREMFARYLKAPKFSACMRAAWQPGIRQLNKQFLETQKKTNLLISDQIKLIKHSIVLCEVFVLQLLLLFAKNGAVDLFFFWFFHCLAGNPPFLCCRCINNIDATNLFMMGIFLIQLLSSLSRLHLLSLPGAQDWEWGRQSRQQPPSWPATSCGHPCWWSAGCPRCWRGCRPGRRGSGHRPSGHTQTGPGQRCHKGAGLSDTREQSRYI